MRFQLNCVFFKPICYSSNNWFLFKYAINLECISFPSIFDMYDKEHIGLQFEVNLASPFLNVGVIDAISKLSEKKTPLIKHLLL